MYGAMTLMILIAVLVLSIALGWGAALGVLSVLLRMLEIFQSASSAPGPSRLGALRLRVRFSFMRFDPAEDSVLDRASAWPLSRTQPRAEDIAHSSGPPPVNFVTKFFGC
jgi:hypothetical protein